MNRQLLLSTLPLCGAIACQGAPPPTSPSDELLTVNGTRLVAVDPFVERITGDYVVEVGEGDGLWYQEIVFDVLKRASHDLEEEEYGGIQGFIRITDNGPQTIELRPFCFESWDASWYPFPEGTYVAGIDESSWETWGFVIRDRGVGGIPDLDLSSKAYQGGGADEEGAMDWAYDYCMGLLDYYGEPDYHTPLFTIESGGEIRIDFDPQPRSRTECMEDDWASWGFANQGQCIRFVNTGKDSR